MPRGTWTAKDERKYEAILESCQHGKRRRSKKTCQRIAAATVNRDRGLRGFEVRERETGGRDYFAFEAQQDGEEVGSIVAAKRKVRGRTVYVVKSVRVAEPMRRRGIATRLYEAAAQEACRRRGHLASMERRAEAYSHDFWAKQEAKGRVEVIRPRIEQPIYILDCAFARDLSGARRRPK
jgi:GNAT superfamily N-acetyltransferase